MISYAKRYAYILSGNPKEILSIPATQRSNAVKSLIILARFLGFGEEFKATLKTSGFKWQRTDALAAFTRIYTNLNSNLGEWLTKVSKVLRPEERLFLRFARASGLRKTEAIESFNLIISLSKQNRLSEYLNSDAGILEHFRYKDTFIRGTKNCYISIIPRALIEEIAESKPVSYNAILKRLQRHKLTCRINELRDAYGTFLVKHNVIKEEVDLLQGRVASSIFVRIYWSPAILEFRDRTLRALAEMEG